MALPFFIIAAFFKLFKISYGFHTIFLSNNKSHFMQHAALMLA